MIASSLRVRQISSVPTRAPEEDERRVKDWTKNRHTAEGIARLYQLRNAASAVEERLPVLEHKQALSIHDQLPPQSLSTLSGREPYKTICGLTKVETTRILRLLHKALVRQRWRSKMA